MVPFVKRALPRKKTNGAWKGRPMMFTVDPKVVEIEKMIKSFLGFKENNHFLFYAQGCDSTIESTMLH